MEQLLANSKFFLPENMRWNFLQEDGVPLESKKRVSKLIVKDRIGYKKIYDLANEMHTIFAREKEVFEFLPPKKANVCKKLGEEILNKRIKVSRGDMNNVADITMLPYMQNSPPHTSTFWVLNQKDMLRWTMVKWSSASNERIHRITDNDRIRVFGLMFEESLREHIPLVTGTGPSTMSRSQLDSQNSVLNCVLQDILRKFNDEEEIVSPPTAWLLDETKQRIGEKTYSVLDPNDISRINVTRTIDGIKTIIRSTTKQYNAVMSNYTKGTGGGDGNMANFSNWKERDPIYFEDYDNHTKSSCLTYIHMWNNEFSHPRVKVNEQLPPSARIEDSIGKQRTEKNSVTKVLEKLQQVSAEREKHSKERLSTMKNLCSDLMKEKELPRSTNGVNIANVLGELNKSSNDDLEMARQYLVKELGDYLPKIKAYTEMATDAQKLMDTDKVTRNQESFLKNKKRMREYTKSICVME